MPTAVPSQRFRRFAAACLLALTSVGAAHHPFAVPRLEGVTPCMDRATVELRYTPKPGTPASANARLAAELDAVLATTFERYAIPSTIEGACRGPGTVRFEAELTWLDPAVYRGYPDGAHGLLVLVHVGDPDVRFQSAASELYDVAVHGSTAEAHLVAVVADGGAALARAWWTANPPAPVERNDRRPMAMGIALALMAGVAAGVVARRRRTVVSFSVESSPHAAGARAETPFRAETTRRR